ncbi:hypothetical protein J5TS2_43680 [Brevibacillus halotolerans]|nr:hypothetical protein J5TS2_43680 [Brevibacillus halotolerans]
MKETLCKLDTIGLVGMQGSDFLESLLNRFFIKICMSVLSEDVTHCLHGIGSPKKFVILGRGNKTQPLDLFISYRYEKCEQNK